MPLSDFNVAEMFSIWNFLTNRSVPESRNGRQRHKKKQGEKPLFYREPPFRNSIFPTDFPYPNNLIPSHGESQSF